MKHVNNGACLKCQSIIGLYPGFHQGLKVWFEELQAKYPEAHVSEAGRGELRQFQLKKNGSSRAAWKQSAHNWNAALDLFCVIEGVDGIYHEPWFNEKLAPEIPAWISWYGRKGSPFPELPHVEVRDWRDLAKAGSLKLVSKMRGAGG